MTEEQFIPQTLLGVVSDCVPGEGAWPGQEVRESLVPSSRGAMGEGNSTNCAGPGGPGRGV